MPLRVLRGVDGAFHPVRDHARLRVCANRVELGRGEARVRHQGPRVELGGREQQDDLRDAVFRDDHHAVAAAYAPFVQLRGGGLDGLQELRAGQAARILDQCDMLRIAGGGERRDLRDAGRQRGQQRRDIDCGTGG